MMSPQKNNECSSVGLRETGEQKISRHRPNGLQRSSFSLPMVFSVAKSFVARSDSSPYELTSTSDNKESSSKNKTKDIRLVRQCSTTIRKKMINPTRRRDQISKIDLVGKPFVPAQSSSPQTFVTTTI